MDKDRIKGAIDKAKGAVKESIGKAIGSDKLRAEGKADQVKGKAESASGRLKDSIRNENRGMKTGTHGAGDGPDD